MQTQTRRLQKVALLASRQEAEFVSGVLDAADIPYAIVEVDLGLELRVDPDDSERVHELIERLDVQRHVAESRRQRQGEASGRRVVVAIVVGVVVGAVVWGVLRGLHMPGVVVWSGALMPLVASCVGAAVLVRRGRSGG